MKPTMRVHEFMMITKGSISLSNNARLMKAPTSHQLQSTSAFSSYFTESMAESVFTDAKVQDWKLPHKVEDVYHATMGSKWQVAHDKMVEAKTVSQPLPRGNAPLQLYSLATPNGE